MTADSFSPAVDWLYWKIHAEAVFEVISFDSGEKLLSFRPSYDEHHQSKLEDQTEQLTRELSATRRDMEDLNEEKRFLEDEVKKVKDMLRSTLEQKAAEQTQHLGIIRDYKDITSSLSRRLDQTEIELARVLRRKPSTMKVTVGNSDMQLTKRVLHTCLPPQLVAELIHTNCPVCLPFLDHHLPTWRQSVSSSTSASCSYTSTSTSISTNANSVIDMISLPQKAALSPPTTGLVGSEVPDRVTPEFDATNLLPEELALENNLESECLEHEEQLMTMRAKVCP
ncbi:unnamed protein product [Protopolystoma xenopodis]|uniref:Uncharacterized protein n=1 Tax=Protopolystoma xenopodis TaxID=117903 RepID=A0A3S5A4K1_9PLAT|nr:unnamed protein product [Protopolystoma xenopodis]